jgi:hypothetical protein
MPKYIGKGTVTEHKGLAKLKTFCANNTPFLVCRDETITDVGIDGEIEISLTNEDGKIEATGERIKFQLKSTESDNSYIQEESETEFKFYANKDDVEYWAKHKQDVLLIIYDARKDQLYGKKITMNDFQTQKQTKIKYPAFFRKDECLLDTNNFDFHKKYSTSIKQRLNFDLHEPALTNIFRIRKFPKVIFTYETNFKKKETIFKSIPEGSTVPEFVIYNQIIFTFVEPRNQGDCFRTQIAKIETEKILHFREITNDKDKRNHFIELIKIYLKKFLRTKGIHYNKDYYRYYFSIKPEEAVRSIFTKTRKQGRKSPKEVAKFYSYGKYQFFRHSAFEIEFIHAESMYMCITPTYFITTDGKTPADGKLASKFIIPQKSREYNPNVANNVHTIFSYLANENGDGITVPNDDGLEIEFSSYIPQKLPFSITTDDKGFPEYLNRQRKIREKESVQTLFANE